MEPVAELERLGVARGDLVGLALAPDVGLAMVTRRGAVVARDATPDLIAAVGAVEAALRPRWVIWSNAAVAPLVRGNVRVATAWDVAAVHRLMFGGWRADSARAWAALHGLSLTDLPTTAPPDLFHQPAAGDGEPGDPVRPDGYLRPEWVEGGWATALERLARWSALATRAAGLQQEALGALADRPMAAATARAESTAELLCAELAVDGLPMDRSVAETLVAASVGSRPRSDADAEARRAERDAEVLRHAPGGVGCDLRSPGQVKELLRASGFDLPDTRAWRLEELRGAHPLIEALLVWRKAERIATTYGYAWLDEHLGVDGRLRGAWSASDGAAGRMTATAGLHNMPADLRAAVVAEPGHVFVRADLGQIEPRVLAAVSGDTVLAEATRADDLYAPVARQLGVDRATAKVAVLGAMYGQTTGHGARALRGLEASYPVAMAYLNDADRSARLGHALRTYGGRLIPMGSPAADHHLAERDARARAGARGRYGRNAMVQGAAAELFKAWAVTVRARAAAFDARIVLCLHDELLVHAPERNGDDVAVLVTECLREAAHRWAPDDSVRFLADVAVIRCWADAKG